MKADKLAILLFSLSTISFFNFIKVPPKLFIYIYDIIFLVTSVYLLVYYKKEKNNRFSFPVFLFLLGIILSCFSCSISWHQNFILTFKSVTLVLSYILFFLLLNLDPQIKFVEKLIIVLGISFMIVYLISFVAYPRVIFRYSYYGTDYRGFQRIVPYGIGFLFILSFYSLNRYFVQHKFSWLILYISTLIFIVMTLTRTLIGVSFVLSALFTIHNSSYLKKILAIVIVSLSIYLISQISYFQIMFQETQGQSQQWDKDIRIRAANYYLHQFSPNIVTKVFGNGNPAGDSEYGNFVKYQLQSKHRYFLSDLGYIGIYVTYGFLSLIALLILFIKVVKTKVSNDYLFVKYFLYFIFIVSIIIPVFVYPDYIPSIVFAIYILYKQELEQSRETETNIPI